MTFIFEILFSIIVLIFPILNTVFFVHQTKKIILDKKTTRGLKKLDSEKILTSDYFLTSPQKIENLLNKKNIANHIRENSYENYKKLYHTTILHICRTIFSVFLFIAYTYLTVTSFDRNRLYYHLAVIPYSLVFIWKFQFSPILKSFIGTKRWKIANAIDNLLDTCLENLFSEEKDWLGKIMLFGITIILLTFNAIIFMHYYKHFTKVLFSAYQGDLFFNILVLSLYQYCFIGLIALGLEKIYRFYIKKRKNSHILNKGYICDLFRNNTYLLFLCYYALARHIEMSTNSVTSSVLLESITILYLIDTLREKIIYSEKNKYQISSKQK